MYNVSTSVSLQTCPISQKSRTSNMHRNMFYTSNPTILPFNVGRLGCPDFGGSAIPHRSQKGTAYRLRGKSYGGCLLRASWVPASCVLPGCLLGSHWVFTAQEDMSSCSQQDMSSGPCGHRIGSSRQGHSIFLRMLL